MTDLPEWMSSKEVAALYRVHISTVQRWVKNGKLPVIRPGGRILRIRREDALALAEMEPEPTGRPPKPPPTTEELEASAKAAREELEHRGHLLMGEGE